MVSHMQDLEESTSGLDPAKSINSFKHKTKDKLLKTFKVKKTTVILCTVYTVCL